MENLTTLTGTKIKHSGHMIEECGSDGQGSGSILGEFLLDGEKVSIYRHWSNHIFTVSNFEKTYTTTHETRKGEAKVIHGKNLIGFIKFSNFQAELDENGEKVINWSTDSVVGGCTMTMVDTEREAYND